MSFWKLTVITLPRYSSVLCLLCLCYLSLHPFTSTFWALISFLSPATPPVFFSQTRIADWREGALNGVYLRRMLQEAAEHIKYYELNATPKGWSCHWDRYALLTFNISKLPRPPKILPCDYNPLSAEVADFVTWLGEKLNQSERIKILTRNTLFRFLWCNPGTLPCTYW